MPSSVPHIIGPYRVERRLGQGGMGQVFLVTKGQRPFEARFALKRMHGDDGDDARAAMFREETKVLTGLAHRNVVRAVDFNQDDDGGFYLVMEYVDGPTLKQLLAHRRLPISLVVHIAQEICRGLSYCHDFARHRHLEEIVHRDIKPENILIDADGTVKLADFGIARFRGRESHTATDQFRGTPWYMSPEHMDPERQLDHRSDLFSLGVVLYELITNANPFRKERGGSAEHAIKAILIDGRFMPIEERVPTLEPELSALVNQLLQQEPHRRPASAQEVLSRLLRLPQRADANELLVEYVASLRGEASRADVVAASGSGAQRVTVTGAPMLDDEAADALEESGTFDPSAVLGHGVSGGISVSSGLSRGSSTSEPRSDVREKRRAQSTSMSAIPALRKVSYGNAWGVALAVAALAVGGIAFSAFERPGSRKEAENRPVQVVPVASATSESRVAPTMIPGSLVERPRVEEAPKPPVVDVTRQEEVADPPANPAPAARTAEPPTASDGKQSKRSPQEGLAQLHVIVYPWGYVWVDGVLHGESPADLPRITPGRHVVGIGQSVDGPAKTFRVRLKPGANEQEYSLR